MVSEKIGFQLHPSSPVFMAQELVAALNRCAGITTNAYLYPGLGVFAAIFSFLLDVVIWFVVLVGSFVLMGWGLKNSSVGEKSKGRNQS